MSWSPVAGADSYNYYSALSEAGSYQLIGTSLSTSAQVINVTRGLAYYFKVAAYSASDSEGYSSLATMGWTNTMGTPAWMTASTGSIGTVFLSWDSGVAGASQYHVYRSYSNSGPWSYLGTVSGTNYTDIVQSGYYYYEIEAVDSFAQYGLPCMPALGYAY